MKWAKEERIIGTGTGVEDLDPDEDSTREVAFVCLYNALEKIEIVRSEKIRKAKEELRKGKRPVDGQIEPSPEQKQNKTE